MTRNSELVEPTMEADAGDANVLTWEDSYAIARALREKHPTTLIEEVSLGMIYDWTLELAGFNDDRELANEAILSAIYTEWFEEVNPL